MTTRIKISALGVIASLSLFGCSSASSSIPRAAGAPFGPSSPILALSSNAAPPTGPHVIRATGRMPKNSLGGILTITDAAPSFNGWTPTAVNLAIVRVDALISGTPNAITVVSFSPPLNVNVLQYQTSQLTLGTLELPAGNYSGLHLVLAPQGNTIAFGTSIYPLPFPTSTQLDQSVVQAADSDASDNDQNSGNVGITFNVPFTNLTSGVSMDFNALESIAQTASGFAVRPAVFAANDDTSGAITGTVRNVNGLPVSNATVIAVGSNAQVSNTTTTANDGTYTLHNVADGTVSLSVYNQYKSGAGQPVTSSGASSTQKTIAGPSVSVTTGSTVTAATIQD